MNKIENLQKKPEAIRRRILFVSVIAIMFLVIVVWIFTLNLSLKNNAQETGSAFAPFNIFVGMFKDAYNVSVENIRTAVDKIKNGF